MKRHLCWFSLFVPLLTLACAAAIYGGASPAMGSAAGLLLTFALPGAAWFYALPADLRPHSLTEHIVLTFGLSIVTSSLCFWLASLVTGFGLINRWLLIETLLILALCAISVLQRSRFNVHPSANGTGAGGSKFTPLKALGQAVQSSIFNSQFPITFVFLLLALLAASLRFANLSYGEFNEDELDVVQSARSLLLGQSNVIYEHRKGPTEIWLTAIAAGASTQFDEWTLRLPFVSASLGALVATMLLGDRMLGKRQGWFAGLLLSGEGIFLAFSRMVQYQSVVLLMIVLVAWCALRFWQAQTRREENLYLALAACFWAFGILTHWDGLPIGAALAWVIGCKWRSTLTSRFTSHASRLALIFIPTLLLPAIFYVQLFLHPQVENLNRYAGGRIGFGIFNNAPLFLRNATFYNASLFFLPLLILGGWALARHSFGARARWLAFALMCAPFLWSNFLQIGDNLNLALLIFVALLTFNVYPFVTRIGAGRSTFNGAAFNVQRSTVQTINTLIIWLLVHFILYAFIIKSPGLHFYTLMPALMLLVSQQGADLNKALTLRFASPSSFSAHLPQWLVFLTTAFLVMLAYAYAYVAFIRPNPEYALRYPQTALWWSPTFYDERPTDFFFAFPYRYGWSVIGELYRRGELRGKFESNETYLVTDWYARDLEIAKNDEPRYYFRVDGSPRAGAVPGDLEAQYQRWGEVRVEGETKIQIYERRKEPLTNLRILNAADFPTHDPLRLERSILYRQFKGDDRAFREAGRYLDRIATASDRIVLDSALQDTIMPYYYRGPARIVSVAQDDWQAQATDGMIFTSLWAGGESEKWLALNAFPLESRWFGSVRIASYQSGGHIADAVMQPSLAQFGESVRLLRYQLTPLSLRAGEVVKLSLEWQTTAALTKRYKIFVHVLDAQGNVIAQRDAEPMADLAPTSSWTPGSTVMDRHGIRLPVNVPPQRLRVALGFYNPENGERLPVRDTHGMSWPNGQWLIEGSEIR